MFPKVWWLCADEAGIEARRKEKKPRNSWGQIELTIPGRSAFRAEELTKRGIINLGSSLSIYMSLSAKN